ncbi:hypothetical protein BOTNAR_0722g00010 [Botryotinia narcissicola]|uniref:DUF946 domain-containing protein n=1 Tax=Botryotinia narcissicola TaxID=278944 RepID=A0A4Z1HE14_9HELO|nr:hypothetical protein BOTNAR_0722g00010 [Botryotinia narcissicola]
MTNGTRTYGDLKVTLTSDYDWLWSDNGTGATRAATFWHPKAQSGEYGGMRPLGSVGTTHYTDINKKQATLLVGATSGVSPAVKSPTGYTRIWVSKDMGGLYDNSTWRPIAPAGYVSMGDIVFDCTKTSWNEVPNIDKVWYLRADLAKRAVYGTTYFWDDKKGGGTYDCSVWQVNPEPVVGNGEKNIPITAGTFRASPNYSKPDSSQAMVPILPCENQFKKFDAPVPKITPSTIPSTGDQFSLSEQCRIALPFTSFFDSKNERCLDFIQDPFIDLSRSIAWRTEGVWANGSGGAYSRQKEIKYGVSKEQSESMTHSAGVEGQYDAIELADLACLIAIPIFDMNLLSFSFNEYSESTVKESFEVPGKNATVLFSKHIWLTASRTNNDPILEMIELVANDDVYFSGCELD